MPPAAAAAVPVPDGKFFQFAGDPRVFLAVGGSFVHVNSWAHLKFQPVVTLSWSAYPQFRSAPADGTFVLAPDTGRVYRFAGGAPIYVDSWAPFGGGQPVQIIPPAAIAGAGTGKWTNLRKTPADGTFVAAAGRGTVYRYVGGAAVYVDSWWDFGGDQAYTPVSPNAIGLAGSGMWTALRKTPADGTFVLVSGTVYQFVDGAMIHVVSWEPFGGQHPYTVLSLMVPQRAGQPPWDNLRSLPRDGKFVVTAGEGHVYQFVGGSPIRIDSWTPYDGPQPTATIDPYSVRRSPDRGFRFNEAPRDGTFVRTAGDGRVYRYAGGAPFYVDSWAPYGGVQPHLVVPAGAVDSAGDGYWSGLSKTPANETFIQTPDGRVFIFAWGAPLYVSSWSYYGGPKPVTRVSAGVVDRAGQGLWANVLKSPPGNKKLIEWSTDHEYHLIGGAPIWHPASLLWGYQGGAAPVGGDVFANAGTGPWSNLRKTPMDGTKLEVWESENLYYEVQAGRLVLLPGKPVGGAALVSLRMVNEAGTGRWWNILPPLPE